MGTSQYLAPILPLMAGIVDAAIPTGSSKPEVWLARWVSWKLHVLRRGAPRTRHLWERRPGDGVTAFGLGHAEGARLLAWSEAAAARKRAKWQVAQR